MGGSGVTWAVSACLLTCGLWSCSSTALDLGENRDLYAYTGYEVEVPVDRAVFILPTEEAREPRVADASSAPTVNYFPDGRWARSPVKMIDAVLREEVAQSGTFTEVLEQPTPEACLLKVRLERFDVGGENHVTGWRSFSVLGMHLQVWGPADETGERLLLLDEPVADAQRSHVSWRPAKGAALMGLSTRVVMHRVLSLLDQSNVARSNVPIGLGQ